MEIKHADEAVVQKALADKGLYWLPETPGEHISGVFNGYAESKYPDKRIKGDVVVTTPVVLPILIVEDHEKLLKRQVSKIIKRKEIQVGTAIKVTYLGEKPSKTEGFHASKIYDVEVI